jgi:hypothetical protein
MPAAPLTATSSCFLHHPSCRTCVLTTHSCGSCQATRTSPTHCGRCAPGPRAHPPVLSPGSAATMQDRHSLQSVLVFSCWMPGRAAAGAGVAAAPLLSHHCGGLALLWQHPAAANAPYIHCCGQSSPHTHRWKMRCTRALTPPPPAQSPTWWPTAGRWRACWTWTQQSVRGVCISTRWLHLGAVWGHKQQGAACWGARDPGWVGSGVHWWVIASLQNRIVRIHCQAMMCLCRGRAVKQVLLLLLANCCCCCCCCCTGPSSP